MSMIEFKGVNKIYPNGTRALNDVSFKVEPGEFVFVIGESGAGKSTIVKMLTCEERPSSGAKMYLNCRASMYHFCDAKSE